MKLAGMALKMEMIDNKHFIFYYIPIIIKKIAIIIVSPYLANYLELEI